MAQILESLYKSAPFSYLDASQRDQLLRSSRVVQCSIGDRILRPESLSASIYISLSGKIRFLAKGETGSLTLALRKKGQIVGWSSLLCANPHEWVIASDESSLLEIPSTLFLKEPKNQSFAD